MKLPCHIRRKFLERCFGTNCGFAATLLLAPEAARRAYGQKAMGDVIGNRPFGRIEKLADGVWAWCPRLLQQLARRVISVRIAMVG